MGTPVDLRGYARLLARRWPVFVVVAGIVGGLLAGASFLIPSTYTAETRVLLSPQLSTEATPDQRRTAALYIDDLGGDRWRVPGRPLIGILGSRGAVAAGRLRHPPRKIGATSRTVIPCVT